MSNQQKQWAIALKKANLKTGVSLELKQKNTVDKIKFQKDLLLKALAEKNFISIKSIFKKIIKLRADLLIISLAKRKKTEFLSEKNINQQVKKYFEQCHQLAKSLGIK